MEFNQVLQNHLGYTVLAEHQIKTVMARPVRLSPYSLPLAYRSLFQNTSDVKAECYWTILQHVDNANSPGDEESLKPMTMCKLFTTE